MSFSAVPLRLTLYMGFAVSLLSFLGGLIAIVLKFTGAFEVPGWASIVVGISFLSGIQLTVLGVIGVYVGRIYDEVKDRPLYFVRDASPVEPRRRDAAPVDAAVELRLMAEFDTHADTYDRPSSSRSRSAVRSWSSSIAARSTSSSMS